MLTRMIVLNSQLRQCSLAQPMKTAAEIGAEEANAEFYKALESGSADRMSEVWLHEEWVRCVHPGWDMVTGWKGVSDTWEKIFEEGPNMRVAPTSVSATVLGEAALVTCVENITVFQEASFDSMQAVASNLFISRGGRWLLVHHHASPVPMVMPDNTVDTIQ